MIDLNAVAMKKYGFILCSLLLVVSCVKEPGVPKEEPAVTPDVKHFQTSQEFEVPVRDGFVTQVVVGGETIAEAVSPMTILLPRYSAATKAAAEPGLVYVPRSEYPNVLENKAKLYQVVCFEDSREGDHDYNDLVIHVLYKRQGNIFGFGVHPVALGSTKSIKLGCSVYKGDTQIFKGLVTPEGKDCRTQYFESQEGFINTVGSVINQQNGGWNCYLASSIRNWDISKYPGTGAMRVEWYIVVDGGVELHALSTKYLDRSFDKNALPYGLVITNTGSQYIEYGAICGLDWFNYPKESKGIETVYPGLWEWLTTDKAFDFADIYSGEAVPADAYPASDLGLFTSVDADVCNSKYRQN